LKPESGKSTFAYQGRVFPYAGWEEKHPNPTYLHTALGYGTETYAAAYPNCRNVFGFFDPLVEATPDGLAMKDQSLSYLVIGWHSDVGGCDPIALESKRMAKEAKEHPRNPPVTLAAALEANYRWRYSAGKEQPGRTLYVAQLFGLEYDPSKGYLAQTGERSPIDVALGGTTAEAFSALMANMLVNKLKQEKPGTEAIIMQKCERSHGPLMR